MSISLVPGSRLPAFCASMGRVLLAALPDAEVRQRLDASPLKANTIHTMTDRDAILAELQRVRAQGFAVIDQELELGLCSIAVPLTDDQGRTLAAINVGTPAALVPAADLAGHFLAELREIAQTLRPLLRGA